LNQRKHRMLDLFVVINCGPCAQFIDDCLASLRSQTYSNWRALVTIDPCGDDTYRAAVAGAQAREGISVRRNTQRQYALQNLVHAVRDTPLDPEDVIVILDGDDRLNTENALSTVSRAYDQHACWMTYGSWVANVRGRATGMWPAYPDGTADFRAAPWLATHLRTWKRWLWDLVCDQDLRDDRGRYFRVAVDLAVMIPLLEICGTERARHIAEPIYFLNREYDWRTDERRYAEQQRNERIIRSRAPYQRRYARPA
jgi:glycosyltransferase involved in cell wall biosynthesis